MKLLEFKFRRSMLIFRYPHVKVLLLIILFITACSQKINPQQSIGASSSTYNGMYLQAKPLSELLDSSEEALVALTFSKALTFAEAQDAMEGMNLNVRVIYLSTGRGSGTMGRPQAISPIEAFTGLRNMFKYSAAGRKESMAEEFQEFKSSNILQQAIREANIDGVNEFNDLREEDILNILNSSVDLRTLAKNFVAEYRLVRDYEEAASNNLDIITGIQVQGKLQDIKTYARKLPTVGYTDEYQELYSSLRPKLPAEIQSIMAQQATMDTSAEKLYADVIEATTYLGISWGE